MVFLQNEAIDDTGVYKKLFIELGRQLLGQNSGTRQPRHSGEGLVANSFPLGMDADGDLLLGLITGHVLVGVSKQ